MFQIHRRAIHRRPERQDHSQQQGADPYDNQQFHQRPSAAVPAGGERVEE
jgi:hypothetical protein